MTRGKLTKRQRHVLRDLDLHPGRTPKELHTRSDLLWRLQELGFATRNLHNQWYVTGVGRQIYYAGAEG